VTAPCVPGGCERSGKFFRDFRRRPVIGFAIRQILRHGRETSENDGSQTGGAEQSHGVLPNVFVSIIVGLNALALNNHRPDWAFRN
jgi:hypothetical protein